MSAAEHEGALLPFSGVTVFVVEDHVDTADAMRLTLESFGARVLLAKDGWQALDVVETAPPDLILCDLRLPGMDGFDLCARLRRNPRCRRIPIVALTGLVGAADQQRALEAGFDGHLPKPLDYEGLLATLQRFLRRLDPGAPGALPAA